jgi:putative photosynthetic complex assembly protein 2
MRLSTKFNIFLGVPNLSEEMLPPHLTYLASFFRRRAMNLLFPVSVSVSSVALTSIIMRAAASDSAFERTSLALLATLLGLGLVEHWFLVLPIRSSGLWTWGLQPASTDPNDAPVPNTVATGPASPRLDPSPASSNAS